MERQGSRNAGGVVELAEVEAASTLGACGGKYLKKNGGKRFA